MNYEKQLRNVGSSILLSFLIGGNTVPRPEQRTKTIERFQDKRFKELITPPPKDLRFPPQEQPGTRMPQEPSTSWGNLP